MQDLEALRKTSFIGEPSLQNALELSIKSLKLLPSHASKEILLIIGSLTTCDPGDIHETIQVCLVELYSLHIKIWEMRCFFLQFYPLLQSMKSEGIRCSVIGVAAELNICKLMAVKTLGEHGVVLDDKHFKEKLAVHIDPPPAAMRLDAALVKMGFPHHSMITSTTETSIAVCMW